MTCDLCPGLLPDYVDDRLAPVDRDALDAHFASHPACQASLRAYEALPKLVRDATDVTMPADARARLREQLRRLHRGP